MSAATLYRRLRDLIDQATQPEAPQPTAADLALILLEEVAAAAAYDGATVKLQDPPADLPGDGLEFPPVDPSDIPPADGTDQIELELAVRESLGLSAEQWAALEEVERGQRIAQFSPAS